MEKVDYLPLGSVVIVRGNIKKFVIIARGLMTQLDEGLRYFDYGGCMYPEGMIGDSIVYFNHADIEEIISKGYTDADDVRAIKIIHDFLDVNDVTYGNPFEINKKNQRVSPQ